MKSTICDYEKNMVDTNFIQINEWLDNYLKENPKEIKYRDEILSDIYLIVLESNYKDSSDSHVYISNILSHYEKDRQLKNKEDLHTIECYRLSIIDVEDFVIESVYEQEVLNHCKKIITKYMKDRDADIVNGYFLENLSVIYLAKKYKLSEQRIYAIIKRAKRLILSQRHKFL